MYFLVPLDEVFTKKELETLRIAPAPVFVLPNTNDAVVVKPKEFETLEELKKYTLENKNRLWVFAVLDVMGTWKLLRHE